MRLRSCPRSGSTTVMSMAAAQPLSTTFFGDAPTPMFEDPPKCWLHSQGNFITSFFPPGPKLAWIMTSSICRPSTSSMASLPGCRRHLWPCSMTAPKLRAVMEYFTHGESVKGWLAAGGALSPHNDADTGLVWQRRRARHCRTGAGVHSVRFDGSDLMPGEVGSGSFWKGMTDYIAGTDRSGHGASGDRRGLADQLNG